RERRQVAVMVQEQVELNGTLGPSELRPVEKRKRQVDHARIQAHELVLEPELLARSAPDHGRLALCQQLLEHRLVERPRPVRVGVGERGPLRGIGKAQVFELALAARQTPADLAEAVGAAELAEEHGDELTPAREPLGGVIGTMLFDRLLELKAGEELQQLREDARKSLHGRASLGDCVLAEINLTQVCPGRAPLISYRLTPPEPSVLRKTVLDKSDDPPSLNKYAYVRNDPINLIDPDGKQFMCTNVPGDPELGIPGSVNCLGWFGPPTPTLGRTSGALDDMKYRPEDRYKELLRESRRRVYEMLA